MKRHGKARICLIFFMALLMSAGCAYPPAMQPTENPEFRLGWMDLSVYKDANRRDKHLRKDLVITVALSGGGLRAANLATGVLLALEQIHHEKKLRLNLLQEIDYFSTVSGGGFGKEGGRATLSN